MSDRTEIKVTGAAQLFLALIPWALGVGALAWLAFFGGLHTMQRELGFEHRADIREQRLIRAVGETKEQTAPLKIVPRHGAITIQDAELDGEVLTVHYKNETSTRMCFIEINWAELAADGTVVSSGGGYASLNWDGSKIDDMQPGDRAEVSQSIGHPEPRAATLRIMTTGQTAC